MSGENTILSVRWVYIYRINIYIYIMNCIVKILHWLLFTFVLYLTMVLDITCALCDDKDAQQGMSLLCCCPPHGGTTILTPTRGCHFCCCGSIYTKWPDCRTNIYVPCAKHGPYRHSRVITLGPFLAYSKNNKIPGNSSLPLRKTVNTRTGSPL